MLELFWESHQERRFTESQSAARQAQDRVAELEARLDKLTLTCAALWQLMKAKTGVSDQQLTEAIREIDLRDGRLDGKVAAEAKACPSCKRTMSKRHNKCLYCDSTLAA